MMDSTSIIGYRLFPPTEGEIDSYKINEKARIQRKIDSKGREIENLRKQIYKINNVEGIKDPN